MVTGDTYILTVVATERGTGKTATFKNILFIKLQKVSHEMLHSMR